MHDLNELRRRAQQLQSKIDQAPDDATAARAADQLHQLLDDADDVVVLPGDDED